MMIDKLACILHTKWEVHKTKNDVIIGNWSEDMNEYNIIVPYQLRSSVIIMQNWLSDKYVQYNMFKRHAQDIKNWFQI